jgi:hypothetical protein
MERISLSVFHNLLDVALASEVAMYIAFLGLKALTLLRGQAGKQLYAVKTLIVHKQETLRITTAQIPTLIL